MPPLSHFESQTSADFYGKQIGSLLEYILFLDNLYSSLQKFDTIKTCITMYV